MPKFSQRSLSNLATCHPDIQILFNEVIKTFDCIVLEGYRSKEEQEKAFNSGHSKVHYPHGKHNRKPSLAVDVYPWPINWDDYKLALWMGGYVCGIAQRLKDEGKITHSIRWGGSWSGIGKLNRPGQFQDTGHFEVLV